MYRQIKSRERCSISEEELQSWRRRRSTARKKVVKTGNLSDTENAVQLEYYSYIWCSVSVTLYVFFVLLVFFIYLSYLCCYSSTIWTVAKALNVTFLTGGEAIVELDDEEIVFLRADFAGSIDRLTRWGNLTPDDEEGETSLSLSPDVDPESGSEEFKESWVRGIIRALFAALIAVALKLETSFDRLFFCSWTSDPGKWWWTFRWLFILTRYFMSCEMTSVGNCPLTPCIRSTDFDLECLFRLREVGRGWLMKEFLALLKLLMYAFSLVVSNSDPEGRWSDVQKLDGGISLCWDGCWEDIMGLNEFIWTGVTGHESCLTCDIFVKLENLSVLRGWSNRAGCLCRWLPDLISWWQMLLLLLLLLFEFEDRWWVSFLIGVKVDLKEDTSLTVDVNDVVASVCLTAGSTSWPRQDLWRLLWIRGGAFGGVNDSSLREESSPVDEDEDDTKSINSGGGQRGSGGGSGDDTSELHPVDSPDRGEADSVMMMTELMT